MIRPQSRWRATWLLIGLAALTVSCEEPDFETHIELIVASGQQPLAGASSVEVEVRYPDGDNINASLSTSSGCMPSRRVEEEPLRAAAPKCCRNNA